MTEAEGGGFWPLDGGPYQELRFCAKSQWPRELDAVILTWLAQRLQVERDSLNLDRHSTFECIGVEYMGGPYASLALSASETEELEPDVVRQIEDRARSLLDGTSLGEFLRFLSHADLDWQALLKRVFKPTHSTLDP